MHNIKSNFDKIHQTIKSLDLNFFDEHGNVPKPGNTPQFSDLRPLQKSRILDGFGLLSLFEWRFNGLMVIFFLSSAFVCFLCIAI